MRFQWVAFSALAGGVHKAKTVKNRSLLHNRDGTASTKTQIVRTPLRVKHDSVGKPDWIFFARFESIYGRAKIFEYLPPAVPSLHKIKLYRHGKANWDSESPTRVSISLCMSVDILYALCNSWILLTWIFRYRDNLNIEICDPLRGSKLKNETLCLGPKNCFVCFYLGFLIWVDSIIIFMGKMCQNWIKECKRDVN